mgnify:CR=1 FL=1
MFFCHQNNEKRISEILEGVEILKFRGNPNTVVSRLSSNSKDVRENYVFVARKGRKFDGHDFCLEAVLKGASSIIAEKDISIPLQPKYFAIVKDSKSASGIMAKNLYDNPTKNMLVIGVTGTKGKTTATHILAKTFSLIGYKTLLLGSISNTLTTPESNDTLRICRISSAEALCMEVTSVAVVEKRLEGINFDCGVFLNLSHDHLDIHKTMDEYFSAKTNFFTTYLNQSEKEKKCAIVNIDDKYGGILADNLKKIGMQVIEFSKNSKTAIYLENFTSTLRHTEGIINAFGEKIEFETNLSGDYNIDNILASVAVLKYFGIPKSEIENGIRNTHYIKGRMELINEGPFIFVDYAHTPESLNSALRFLKNNKTDDSKLIVVFGCGGDRDKEKRPLMGKIAAEIADLVFVTSDNPRSENPVNIIEDILKGIENTKREKINVFISREEAILKVIEKASKKDLVLIAGKGHEEYQILKDEVIDFSDVKVAKMALKKLVVAGK